MAVLAQRAARTVGLPYRGLLQGRRRADQAGLGFAQRRQNMRHAVRVREPGSGPVVVVDGARTAGANMDAGDGARRTAGYTPLAHVVIASAMGGPDVR